MSSFFTKRASGTSEMDTWMQESEAAHEKNRPIDVPGVITFDRTDNGWKANVVQNSSSAVPVTYHPFKVYKSPPNPEDDPEDSAKWRTFRVRAGAYGTTAVDGTDGANESPDDPASPVTDKEYSDVIDIIVPADTEKYYIWLDASDPESPLIDHSATIPGDGTDEEWGRGTYFLLCIVNTLTYAAKKKAIRRQYVRDDIPKCVTS